MKPTNILHRYKTQFLAKLPDIAFYVKTFTQLGLLAGLSAAIWAYGPLISINHVAPFVQAEKRFYLIVFLFLIWLLKFLLIDLDTSHPFHFNDTATRKKLKALQSRFQGVMQFLKQTTVTRHGQQTRLQELPWYFLIGPSAAGKTTLLANSKVHFVLQRQFQTQQSQNIMPSEQCDWWVTRDATIIDVPGNYMAVPSAVKSPEDKSTMFFAMWRSFLRLTRKQRGKGALEGLVIALPLPEMMKQGDPKKYQTQLKYLFLRIAEIQSWFPKPIPCYLVITKCDQLTGFTEFFSDSGDDEITQSWGLTLPKPRPGEKAHDLFANRFDSLIKKLNQQLLWRLHQERNPLARPYIKDFPLQVERLKEFTLDFVKKFAEANFLYSLQGIYLTSALQVAQEPEEASIIDAPNSSQRAIQIFKEPKAASRPYFIKQFLLQGFAQSKPDHAPTQSRAAWKKRFAYAAAVGVVGFAAVIFGRDFEHAIMQAYRIQNTLSNYQLTIQQTHNADDQLSQTIALLNTLKQDANATGASFNVSHLLTFYSNKSKQKSSVVYRHALQNILMPQVKNYLGEYLKNPVNKNAEDVYAALKAYLMLNDAAHFQAEFIANTFQNILPKSIHRGDIDTLMMHVRLALTTSLIPMPVDERLIADSRRYLTALPSFQLAYIILKNLNNNNIENEVNLGTQQNNDATFVSRQVMNQVPRMFTAQAFANIIAQETTIAAQEATTGNWILGSDLAASASPEATANLLQQLRNTYINNYVDVWESLLANIHLSRPKDLAQTNALILSLTSNNSPLLQLLQTLHDNTYFEPITTSSPKLQSLGLLVDKNNQSDNLLYQIFSGLQSLHQYLNTTLTADNERKAAFEAVSLRMQHTGELDAITQLRLIAEKSPEPVKSWLNKLTNDAWRYLLQEATRYIDLSWQDQVSHIYEAEIANHYPFNGNATQEVPLQQFTSFFGNPGTLITFYNHYLQPFVDTTTPEWRWKTLDNQKLPFSDETLHQLQMAYRIHHMFFPNGDNNLHVQFALQPYQLGKMIKSVKLRINDKKVLDQRDGPKSPHLLSWPSKHDSKMTSVQFTMQNEKTLNRDFPGDWGWFKLVHQSLVSAITNRELIIDLSEKKYPVKYLLFTQGSHNPFVSFNLQNLQLPRQLTDTSKSEA